MEALAGTIAADADGHWRVASPSAIGAPLEAPQQQQQSAAVASARERLNILAAAAGPVLPPPTMLTGLWSPARAAVPDAFSVPDLRSVGVSDASVEIDAPRHAWPNWVEPAREYGEDAVVPPQLNVAEPRTRLDRVG